MFASLSTLRSPPLDTQARQRAQRAVAGQSGQSAGKSSNRSGAHAEEGSSNCGNWSSGLSAVRAVQQSVHASATLALLRAVEFPASNFARAGSSTPLVDQVHSAPSSALLANPNPHSELLTPTPTPSPTPTPTPTLTRTQVPSAPNSALSARTHARLRRQGSANSLQSFDAWRSTGGGTEVEGAPAGVPASLTCANITPSACSINGGGGTHAQVVHRSGSALRL